ncbi:MAG TPA: hypothetical protein VJN18_30905 [Polyangiaceae bacterium]|nr:hypothetical protein [Polyangiaceae bacterium]
MSELRGGRSRAIGGRVKGPVPTTIVERPPPGPARGNFPAPLWLVVALGAMLLALSAYSLTRAWKRRAR